MSEHNSSILTRRYGDAYTQAHALVTVGKLVKAVAWCTFAVILFVGSYVKYLAGFDTSLIATGILILLAFLVGIFIYVIGILIAAQGQTALAVLDVAINSSRHLTDDDVGRLLSRRFCL